MPGYYAKPKKVSDAPRLELQNVTAFIRNSPDHSKLYALLQKFKLVSALNAADNVTVFAPTNAAFTNIDSVTKQKLLDHVLQYSKAPPPNYQKMKTLKSLAGNRHSTDTLLPLMKNGQKCQNGVVYSIANILPQV